MGTTRDGQIVRVRSPKCTIGSGPHCTIRLRARGIYPLHCLILRGAEATVVRRWAPDTLLNGQTFTDSKLLPGDRLSIGRVQLEVLPGPTPCVTEMAPRLSQPGETPPADPLLARQLAGLESRLALANRQGRQRSRRLLSELRATRRQMDSRTVAVVPAIPPVAPKAAADLVDRERQLQQAAEELHQREVELAHQTRQFQTDLAGVKSQRQHLEQQRAHLQEQKTAWEEQCRQRTTALDARQQELEAAGVSLQQQQAAWEATCLQSRTSHDSKIEQFERQEAELHSQRVALEEARRQWEQEQTKARDQLDQQAQALASRQAELQTSVDELEQRQRDWQDQCDRESQEVAQQRESLEAQRDELEEERKTLCEQQERWERERAEQEDELRRARSAAEAATTPETAESSGRSQAVTLDSMELFRRLGTMPNLEEDETPPPAPPTPPRATPANPTTPSTGHEDESVDQYMARLLERVRGQSESPSPPPVPEQRSEETVALEPEPPAVSIAPAVLTRPSAPVSMAPRTVAPERFSDLSAMRELANFSAQAALDQHLRRRLVRTMRMKLLAALAAILAGGLMFSAWWFGHATDLAMYGAGVSFLIALMWVVQYAVLTGHLIVSRSGHLQWSEGQTKAAPKAPAPSDGEVPAELAEKAPTEEPTDLESLEQDDR